MNQVIVYSGSIGINNKVPGHRLRYDSNSGVSALISADNVLIDNSGQIVSIGSNTLIKDGIYHSIIEAGNDWGLVVEDRDTDSAIIRVNVTSSGDTRYDGVVSGLKLGNRVEWAIVNDHIFYSDRIRSGIIINNGYTSIPWVSDITDDLYKLGFVKPPVPEHMCYSHGRMFMSVVDGDKYMVVYTEFGMLGVYNPSVNGEQFSSRIIMIIPSHDGIYICTEDSVFFLFGLNPKEWESKKVLDYPVIEWCVDRKAVYPNNMGIDIAIPSIIAGTINGPVLFAPSGNVFNLIDNNISLPNCMSSGALAVFDKTLIIQTGE